MYNALLAKKCVKENLRPLTPRELEMLQCIMEGMCKKEISRKFNISEMTVKNHLGKIGRKMGFDGKSHPAQRSAWSALLWGLIDIPFKADALAHIPNIKDIPDSALKVEPTDWIRFGNILVSPQWRVLQIAGVFVITTDVKFRLLETFITHPNRVLSRDFIIDRVYGEEAAIEDRRIDVHVSLLRKIMFKWNADSYVSSIPGLGYRLNPRHQQETPSGS